MSKGIALVVALHTILSLASGIGGLDLGVKRALGGNARTACYVENEITAAAILAARMAEKRLDEAPIWSDLKTFDGRSWRGLVDGITGGYPCQPFSVAGLQRGVDDPRHLWPYISGIIADVEPAFCFFENVANHLQLGFREVATDLQGMGYCVAATLWRAEEVGAPHRRERLFILAVSDSERGRLWLESGRRGGSRGSSELEPRDAGEAMADATGARFSQGQNTGTGSGDEGAGAGGSLEPQRSSGKLADAERARWAQAGIGRDLDAGAQPQAGSGDGAMGDAGRREPKQLAGEWSTYSDASGGRSPDQHPRSSGRLDSESTAMGDADFARLEGWRGALSGGGDELPAWPPGPSDHARWSLVPADYWPATPQPALRDVADGSASWLGRADQLRALGNAVVPAQAAAAFRELTDAMTSASE